MSFINKSKNIWGWRQEMNKLCVNLEDSSPGCAHANIYNQIAIGAKWCFIMYWKYMVGWYIILCNLLEKCGWLINDAFRYWQMLEKNIFSMGNIFYELYEIRIIYSPETPNQRHVRIRLWVRICGHASSIWRGNDMLVKK